MTNASSPTVRRRVLARELKDMRQAARLTHIDVADRLGWQQGKVSKIEGARQAVPVEVVLALAEVCHATPQQRDRLVELSKAARVKGWWESYDDVLSSAWKTYLGLETDADSITVFATELVPELAQTADYARSVLATRTEVDEPDRRVERRVELLLERQRNLLEQREVELDVVLAESVLLRAVGGDRVLREQMRHTAELADRPHVTVRVLPFSAGALPVDGPFTVFGFRQEPHPAVLFIPTRLGGTYLEQEHDVLLYREITRELKARSLSAEESCQFLRRAGSLGRAGSVTVDAADGS